MGKYVNVKMIVGALVAIAAWDMFVGKAVKDAFKK